MAFADVDAGRGGNQPVPALSGRLETVVPVLPIYTGFLIGAAGLGWATARLGRFDVPASRALVFSGATRNSLEVLPLALALPAAFAVTPAVIVAQTLVELIGMIVYVLIPRLAAHPR